MKTTILVLFMLSISFIPLAISSSLPPLIRLPVTGDAVLDIDGNPVVAGKKYYAVPVPIGVEGAVSEKTYEFGDMAAVVINMTTVGNQPSATGHPLVFYPHEVEATVSGTDAANIQESFPLTVAFDASEPSKERVWKLVQGVMFGLMEMVSVTKEEGETYSWFRIMKNVNGRGYIFTYWPSLCLGCRIAISRIGVVSAVNQLGINEDAPYPFYFVKAE